MAEGDAPAVQVADLSFAVVPGGPALLRGVSLALPKGARCVLIGRNGAGKSTLLELIAGAKMGPSGAVKVFGVDPFRGNAGQKVTLVQGGWRGHSGDCLSEDRAAFMKVWQMLGMEDPAAQASVATTDARTDKLHGTFGLSRLVDRYMGSLSDGERRKVELARKLREPREVVLLDEATMDLDLFARKAVLDFLASDGATVINVTHVFDGLEPWATHVAMLHDGETRRCEVVARDSPAPWHAEGGLFALAVAWLRAASAADGIADANTAMDTGPAAAPNQAPAQSPGDGAADADADAAAVRVGGLAFAYAPWCPVALRLDKLALGRGSRCVLVGPNGAGKSSLLSVLGGRRMVAEGDVLVLGLRAFHEHVELDKSVVLLSSEWKRQVSELSAGRALTFREVSASALQDLAADGHDMRTLAARMLRLVQMLDIDPAKPLGALSDGNLRRVQIALKLLRPSRVVLVDEVTADLDVLARQALLGFLRQESESGCTIVYCTHIMDGLDGWSTHTLRLRPLGADGGLVDCADFPGGAAGLLPAVLAMLEEDAALPEPPPPPKRAPPRAGPRGQEQEEGLPSGWLSRGASQAGAYGSYAWNADHGSEDTWSYSSVAPTPGPARPARADAAAGPPDAGPGAPPRPGAFAGAPPGAGPGWGAAGLGGPAVGPGLGAGYGGGAPPLLGAAAAPPFGQAAAWPPPAAAPPAAWAPAGAAADAARAAGRGSDDCPFGAGPRGNSMGLEELAARGLIPPGAQ